MARHKGATGCSVASAAAKRKGRFSKAEQAALIHAAQSEYPVEKAAEKLAPIMERSELAIKNGIIKARQELQSQAAYYVALHRKAAEKAAEMGNSKPVEWMLDRLEKDGERVVPAAKADLGGKVQIVFANVKLGGMEGNQLRPLSEVIDAE